MRSLCDLCAEEKNAKNVSKAIIKMLINFINLGVS